MKNSIRVLSTVLAGVCLLIANAAARELHVSVHGRDTNDGSSQRPFRSISAAARAAFPGDVVTVHEGIYRERIDPPRGGESDDKRIVYQAAVGERVEIRGSEVIRGWENAGKGVWTVALPNSFFGSFNPYSDTIRGDWFNPLGRTHHTGAVYLNGEWLDEAATLEDVFGSSRTTGAWFGVVDTEHTTLWAVLPGVDPDTALVEINVRQSVFFPVKTGINYVTVRGFTMRHAATNWAPPTARQVGLIGPHWSRGWIIEKNVISHSRCSGISLGKYGDLYDNTSANSAEGYVETVRRALAAGWDRETVGHHVVRDNVISHCEQAGIVGSLGAVYSRIEGNHIRAIHVRRLFSGDELAAIKLHGAIDVTIQGNRIHDSWRGLWLDWMAQGTRVTGNLFYDNGSEDVFVEVNHGPFLIDNNLLLSRYSLMNASEGGAYVHNLFAGATAKWIDLQRFTPYHPPHSTRIAGLDNIKGGDDRFFNNVFAPARPTEPIERYGLGMYDSVEFPVHAAGNVYVNGARPYPGEHDPLVTRDVEVALTIEEREDGVFLRLHPGEAMHPRSTSPVTTGRLGQARVSRAGYENPDGSPVTIDRDYFGVPRDPVGPGAGPFARPLRGTEEIKVW